MKKKLIYNTIVSHLNKYSTAKIGVFGSFARDENTDESDIDILVNFRRKIDYLELVGIELDLSEMLEKKVDLVTERSIDPKLKPHIYNDLRIMYQ